MPAKIKVRPHRILVRAEMRQAVFNEILESDQSLLARNGPIETREIAGMICEFFFDQIKHFLGDRAVFVNQWLGHILRASFAKRFAILSV